MKIIIIHALIICNLSCRNFKQDKSICEDASFILFEKIQAIDSTYPLDSFNKMFLKCPELASKDYDYKYELLMLSKKYDQALLLMNSIDSNKFICQFRPKELYINLAKGLKFNYLNKKRERDSIFNIISNSCLKFINNNLSNELAIYYYVKIMNCVEDKNVTLSRLDKIFVNENYGNFNYISFKEDIIKNSFFDIGFYNKVFIYNYRNYGGIK